MTYSYFPGCTLKTKGKDLDLWGRASMEALGIQLQELPQWQCCGAVYPQARDEIATKLSAGASDALLRLPPRHQAGQRRHAVRRDHPLPGQRLFAAGDALRGRDAGPPLSGGAPGRRGLRGAEKAGGEPPDGPENPAILEDFIRAIGAEPVVYAMRNECCGGYTTLENKDYAARQAGKVLANALNCGAEELITACPLCLYNLQTNGGGALPVRYFTELLAQALGVKEGTA